MAGRKHQYTLGSFNGQNILKSVVTVFLLTMLRDEDFICTHMRTHTMNLNVLNLRLNET